MRDPQQSQPLEWLARLSEQYERFPYPHRDPEAESLGDTRTINNTLATIAHFLNRGQAMHGQGFRALVAGGGTGDATVHLATQLQEADPDGEVVHVDLSSASLDIARRRVEKLGLKNVSFIQQDIYDLSPEELGGFDYINCSGVLHHLPDPVGALATLRGVLKPHGGLSLMLYGAYGRIGVYHVQDLVSRLADGSEDLEHLAEMTRSLLKQLPSDHWLVRKAGSAPDVSAPAAEIVDKYLHSRDRPYTVPDIFQLVEEAGVNFVSFTRPLWYDPRSVLGDQGLSERMDRMTPAQRMALAEILHGSGLSNHFFFVSARESAPELPDPHDVSLVPTLVGQLPTAAQGQIVLGGPRRDVFAGRDLQLVRRIDGVRTLGEIRDEMLSGRIMRDEETFWRIWDKVYTSINGRGLLVMKAWRDDADAPAPAED